jgi:hypothetical protein
VADTETSGQSEVRSEEAEVVSLKRERIAREPRMRELNEIADQAIEFARERRKYVHMGGETPQEEDAYFRQWGLAAATHSRAILVIHKHTEFLERDD